MSPPPSALPLPKAKTHFDLAGALVEGFLGGAFGRAAGLRGAALPAGRLLIDLIPRDVDLTTILAAGVKRRPSFVPTSEGWNPCGSAGPADPRYPSGEGRLAQ
jgi:hypothetical protein